VRDRRCLAAFLFSVCIALLGSAWGEENLLLNPGFEDGVEPWKNAGNAAFIGRVTWHAQSSDWSVGVGNDEGVQDAYGEWSQVVQLPAVISDETKYTFTVHVLVETSYKGKTMMKLEFQDRDGDILETAERSFRLAAGQNWQKRRLKDLAPAGTKSIRVICRSEEMQPGTGRSVIWFDNVSLEESK